MKQTGLSVWVAVNNEGMPAVRFFLRGRPQEVHAGATLTAGFGFKTLCFNFVLYLLLILCSTPVNSSLLPYLLQNMDRIRKFSVFNKHSKKYPYLPYFDGSYEPYFNLQRIIVIVIQRSHLVVFRWQCASNIETYV